jgi:hypothetical protein
LDSCDSISSETNFNPDNRCRLIEYVKRLVFGAYMCIKKLHSSKMFAKLHIPQNLWKLYASMHGYVVWGLLVSLPLKLFWKVNFGFTK